MMLIGNGLDMSDLFFLIICQVRNHDANNVFSIWSWTLLVLDLKSHHGPEAFALNYIQGHCILFPCI